MRSMVLEFTEDKNCAYLDKQYMLGDSLMVAPIFNEESTAEYYLPKGTWTNYFTGEKKIGGSWYTETCPYLEIPLFVRENSIIAMNDAANKPDYDFADGVTLKAYALVDGVAATTAVYDMKANLQFTASVTKNCKEITINADAKKPFSVLLVGETACAASGNAKLTQTEKGTLVSFEAGCECIVTLE